MDTAPGARGIVIGDRYRVAGALRRTGLIDAVDLEADRTEAACRVVGVPGDAEGVDAWEDAWLAAQDAARLPRLREIVTDEDGAHWAILGPSPAANLPLPADAAAQARVMGETLVGVGLDVNDVTPAMLVTASDGQLHLDGVVWLGGDHTARAAGRALVELLPRPAEADGEVAMEQDDWARPRRRTPQRRPRRTRILVPAAIVAVLAAAALVLLVPSRSGGTAVLAPAGPTSLDDVILGSAQYPLVSPEAIAVPSTQPAQGVQEGAQSSTGPENAGLTASEQEVPETVTVVVPVTVEQAVNSLPESVAPALPVAAAQQVPNLPVADDTPALPLATGG
jgi:hypothetical protein